MCHWTICKITRNIRPRCLFGTAIPYPTSPNAPKFSQERSLRFDLMDGEICSLLEVSQSPLCVRDYNKSISTTSQRQAAFARFRKYDTSRVLAWLEDFHLLQPDHQHQSCSAYLNQQELDALSASRVCHDDHISEWLRLSTPIVPAG